MKEFSKEMVETAAQDVVAPSMTELNELITRLVEMGIRRGIDMALRAVIEEMDNAKSAAHHDGG